MIVEAEELTNISRILPISALNLFPNKVTHKRWGQAVHSLWWPSLTLDLQTEHKN